MQNTSELVKEMTLMQAGLTHLGNALRLQRGYKNRLKFNPLIGKWYFYNDVVWEYRFGVFFRMIDENNSLMRLLAEDIEDKKVSQKILSWCHQSESYSNMSSTEKLARTLDGFKQSYGWDNKPYLFACENGVINLQTGLLEEGKAPDLLTLQSPITYNPLAECPLWEKFIYECFNEDLDLIHYVQKALGYSLTGNNKEQVIFIGYGTGSNGKSTLLRIILKILGEYGHTAARSTFQANKYNDQTNDIAQLVAKRFVSWSETRMSASLDEEKIKAMTGGENQRARFLFQDFFEFQPILKLWMFFNHKPIARDDSQGFWRRIRIIPFNHIFDGKDKDIDIKLSQELPGVLRWLVEGCLMWQKEGLSEIPEKILTATQIYREESDPLSQWLEASVIEKMGISEGSTPLFLSYKKWCQAQGMDDREILNATNFGRRMATKFEKRHTRNGNFYIDIALNE